MVVPFCRIIIPVFCITVPVISLIPILKAVIIQQISRRKNWLIHYHNIMVKIVSVNIIVVGLRKYVDLFIVLRIVIARILYKYIDRFAIHSPKTVVSIFIRFSIVPERAIVVAIVVASVGPLDIYIRTSNRRPIRSCYLAMDQCVQLDHIKVLNIAIRSKRSLDPGTAIARPATILENTNITIRYIIVFVNGYIDLSIIIVIIVIVVIVVVIICVNTNIVGSIGSCDTHSNQVTIVPVPYRNPHIRNAD